MVTANDAPAYKGFSIVPVWTLDVAGKLTASGWNQFDEKSQPYTPDQVRRERQQYGQPSAVNREGVIPVVEEELGVEKRDVDQGGVKVKATWSKRGEASREPSAVGKRTLVSRSHHRGGAKGSRGSGFEASPSHRGGGR